MRTDVLEIDAFYQTPLGDTTTRFISNRLQEAWGTAKGLRVAGFGYPLPFMPIFREAERSMVLLPEGMGALTVAHQFSACLTCDNLWPLADASLDRILIVHGLEEAAAPRRLLREAWRVLTDDGMLIVIVPNRRGPWAMVETTPFSAGRPYLRGQMNRLLKSAMFTPTAWSSALYFPPVGMQFLLRAAKAWEQAGEYAWSAFAGVTLVEARKELAIPAGGSKLEVLKPRVIRPATTRSAIKNTHRR